MNQQPGDQPIPDMLSTALLIMLCSAVLSIVDFSILVAGKKHGPGRSRSACSNPFVPS